MHVKLECGQDLQSLCHPVLGRAVSGNIGLPEFGSGFIEGNMEANASAVFYDSEAQLSALRDIEVVGAGVSADLLIALIAAIHFELQAANASITVRRVFNPFNASLLLMGWSLAFPQIAGSLYTDSTLHDHLVGFMAYGYMLYSWYRGAAVLRHMFSRYATYFGAILVDAPGLFAATTSVDM
ncbi:hypothetical protein HDU80_001628 [Chytriomyces hyalinus]|nr:hypothetical protein HDU80_001628 [Chytriomyces hyalinus]